MIVVNAMFLQHGHHPAPLFGSTVKIEPPKPPARPSSIDALINERIPPAPLQPVNAAPEAAFSAPVVDDQPDAQPADRAPAAQAPVAQAAVAPVKKSHDLIGALIAGSGVVTPAVSGKSVMTAQRALQKLAHPVKPDGDYGSATRKAVEAFQRDNHLPVTGSWPRKPAARSPRALASRWNDAKVRAYFSALSCMTMMVCCMSAQAISLPSLMAKTSALVMISVRPGRTTWPRATSFSPSAGRHQVQLEFHRSTEQPAGTMVMAAWPAAESAICRRRRHGQIHVAARRLASGADGSSVRPCSTTGSVA